MKQTRKNKTNQAVIWPTSTFFTIRELCKLNPEFVEITLRVRLTNAIADGTITEIGSTPSGKGRPQKVFTPLKVTKMLLDEAERRDITLVDRAREKLVNVVSVNNPTSVTSSPSVVPSSVIAPSTTVKQ